jgi:hypothetical protein
MCQELKKVPRESKALEALKFRSYNLSIVPEPSRIE